MKHSTYRSGPARTVFDPYEWLPEYGETSVEAIQQRGDLRLRVTYDSPDQSSMISRDICFHGTCCWHYSALPGISLLNVGLEGVKDKLTDLLDFPSSEAAGAWSEHWGTLKIRQYWIYFAAQNCCYQIFAESVTLGDPSITPRV